MADMGIGRVGQPGTIIKRKFRFTMEVSVSSGGEIPKWYVKLAGRPKLSIDSTEINFLNATTWLPGKAKWEPITVTYIDTTDSAMQGLYNWIATVYDFQQSSLPMSEKSGWDGTVTIRMYDGCGHELERWILKSCYPESVDFGEMSYAESEEATIELQLRYSEVQHQGVCGPTAAGSCKGC